MERSLLDPETGASQLYSSNIGAFHRQLLTTTTAQSSNTRAANLAFHHLSPELARGLSSLDPPAAGPDFNNMPPSSRSSSRVRASAISVLEQSTVLDLPMSATNPYPRVPQPARTRRRTSNRQTTEPEGPISVSENQEAAAPEVVRRSSRRKRAPAPVSLPAAAAVAASSTREDPPAKRSKRANLKKPPPGLKSDDAEDSKMPAKDDIIASCCICMDEPKPEDLAKIVGCDHLFCFDCIEKWAERENSCPLCKVRFTKIARVNKAKKKPGEKAKNSKRIKRKDQRSDLAPGAALEGLLASFASSANFPPHRVARLIFSGMGGHGNPFLMAPQRNATAGTAATMAAHAMDASLFSDSDDEDDSATFLQAPRGGIPHAPSIADLFRSTRTNGGFNFGGHHGLHAMGLSGGFDPPPGRSYASNASDRNAGRGAENPLEIDDSDDDDDVEIVRIQRPRGSR